MTGPTQTREPPHAGEQPPPAPSGRVIGPLVAWQLCALAGQVVAVWLARHERRGLAELLSYPALGLAFGSALWVLLRPDLTRAARNAAVICLGITPTLLWRSTNPLLFTGFDEQLHMRTLSDIVAANRLFEANPLLGVSPRYPGLESTTALLVEAGLPDMVAALAVILIARLVLVTVLCDAVEQLTGSMRAGGLAVAVYAVSPQFVFFNSQYSYQTLALPLALAAISLIARSRQAAEPLPLLAGATVCLAAVVITHHVAGFVVMVMLVLWATAERGAARLRIGYGTLAAIATALAWALIQRSILQEYFGPIVDDVRGQIAGGARRRVFSDGAGTASSLTDRALLLYYAAVLSLVVLVLVVVSFRRWRRGVHHWHPHRPHRLGWNQHLLLLSFIAATPVLLAARVLPKGGELFDRGSSFLFLPISLFVAGYAAHHFWPPGPSPLRRLGVVVLAAGVFLGGYVLGSGPNWARLPGPYLTAADTRAMDPETLAAAEWADDALADGSRIAADRVSSVLLASESGVWPVMKGSRGVDVAALYFAERWDEKQTEIAASMRLRYLYVDSRLAMSLPRFGSYFFSGETGTGRKLTESQLAKFSATPGITLVYRHGPVSIYDLKGLGIPELRSGWFGGELRRSAWLPQIGLGVLAGLVVVLATRGLAPLVGGLRRSAGPALLAGIALAAVCLTSICLLLLGIPVTPLTALVTIGIVLSVRWRSTARLARDGLTWLSWRRLAAIGLIAVPLAGIGAVAVTSAAGDTVTRVRQILNDPAAVRIDTTGPAR